MPPPKYWRSLLYVPSNNDRFVGKAATRGADAVILDLEDSIPAAEKQNARAKCVDAIDSLIGCGSDIMVRINAPMRLAVRDLESIVRPGVTAVVIPKVESAGALHMFEAVIAELEHDRGIPPGTVAIIPVLESPKALLVAHEIAPASVRNVGLLFGGEDFATACGITPDADTLHLPKLQVALAAKAAGLLALGVLDTIANISDPQHFGDIAERSARFGFDGATCIHPAMVPMLNQAFSPSPEAIAQAQKIVDTMEQALSKNQGTARIDNKMIDMPIYQRAKTLLLKSTRKP